MTGQMSCRPPQFPLRRSWSCQRLAVERESPRSNFMTFSTNTYPNWTIRATKLYEGDSGLHRGRLATKRTSFRLGENISKNKYTSNHELISMNNVKPTLTYSNCEQRSFPAGGKNKTLFRSVSTRNDYLPRNDYDYLPRNEYLPEPFSSEPKQPRRGYFRPRTENLIARSVDNLGQRERCENINSNTEMNARFVISPTFRNPPKNSYTSSPVKGILKSSSQSSYSTSSDEDGKERKPSTNTNTSNDSSGSKTSKKRVQFHEMVTRKTILPSGSYQWYCDKLYQDMKYIYNNSDQNADDVFFDQRAIMSHYKSPRTDYVTRENEHIHYIGSNDLPNYIGDSVNLTGSLGSLTYPSRKNYSNLDDTEMNNQEQEKGESEITFLTDCALQDLHNFDTSYHKNLIYGTNKNKVWGFDKTGQQSEKHFKEKENRPQQCNDKNTMSSDRFTSTLLRTQKTIKSQNYDSLDARKENNGPYQQKSPMDERSGVFKVKRHESIKWPKCFTKSSKTKDDDQILKNPQAPALNPDEKTLRIIDWIEDVNSKGDNRGISFLIPRPTLRRSSFIGK